MLDVIGIFLVLTAVFAYFNHRYIGLPPTIGVMGIALLLSIALILLDLVGIDYPRNYEEMLMRSVDFSEVLLQGMLSVLLFAGALHVDSSKLKSYRVPVGLLAVLGTTVSMLAVGYAVWALLPLLGISLPFAYCLVFGALIAPTDPISVLGILKSAGAPKSLELVISGESLFNDGVGVVLFSIVLALAASGEPPTVSEAAILLLQEGGGGIAFGLVLGYVTYRLLKSIDSYQEEVMITLAAVIGGYALAMHLHVSGPLTMVVAGLIIGNHGRALAMSDETKEQVDMFWELLDAILNAVLFLLIGLEVVLIAFTSELLMASAAAIAITLGARFITVGMPIALFRNSIALPPGSWQTLTWGGLRGGISVALALSIPHGPYRDTILTLTYAVVVFSILVQGLSIKSLVRKVTPCSASPHA